MTATLIELTLRESHSSEAIVEQSFNNDSAKDKMRNYFCGLMPSFNFFRKERDKVPPEYLYPNVHHFNSNEIFKLDNKIIVGEYCNNGVIVPQTGSIIFNKLYNCSPLISFIKGDEDYISFLHTWAIRDDYGVVDRQVNHWMETISKLGDISETVFAPRKGNKRPDTKYKNAIDEIIRISQKTIVLSRDITEVSGIANGKGIYFRKCGYHLWGS